MESCISKLWSVANRNLKQRNIVKVPQKEFKLLTAPEWLLVIILMVSGYYTRNEHSKNHTLHPSRSQIWINRSFVVVVADGKTDDDEQDSLPSSAGSEKSSGSSWASRHVAGTHPWASSVLTNHQPEKSERRMSDDDRRFIYQHLTMTVPPLSSLGSGPLFIFN